MKRVLLLFLIAFAAAAPARAATPAEKIANQVFTDYTKDGDIDACDYTTDELQTALDNVEPNVRQYASDYPAAIRSAIRFHARGGCDQDAAVPAATAAPAAPSSPAGTAAAPPASTAVAPAIPGVAAPPGPDTAVPSSGGTSADTDVERAAAAAPDNHAPAPLVGLGLLAVLLALTAALLLTIRRLGRGEGRLAPTYHSWREARWRAGGVWADFRDWLSLGR